MFRVRHSAATESTNDDAAALLGTHEGAGLVLATDYQRAGRARRARTWLAPPGSSLLFTAILPREVAAAHLWLVPFWTALGVARGIEDACGLRVELQWPNDLLLEGRKVCGILCISRVAGASASVGCGVGLNVARPLKGAGLDDIVPPPAFLSDRATHVEREPLLAAILSNFERSLPELDLPSGVARDWEARAGLAGTPYCILRDGEAQPFEAIALRLSEGGGLVVERDGREVTVSLADARVLRT